MCWFPGCQVGHGIGLISNPGQLTARDWPQADL